MGDRLRLKCVTSVLRRKVLLLMIALRQLILGHISAAAEKSMQTPVSLTFINGPVIFLIFSALFNGLTSYLA